MENEPVFPAHPAFTVGAFSERSTRARVCVELCFERRHRERERALPARGHGRRS